MEKGQIVLNALIARIDQLEKENEMLEKVNRQQCDTVVALTARLKEIDAMFAKETEEAKS